MNQILISEKLYMTPEIKKKKTMYKVYFFLSVILIFILSSYYIYAEYDKNKEAEQSQEILASLSFKNNFVDDTTIKFEENAIVVILNDEVDKEPLIISSTFEDVEIDVENEDNTITHQTAQVEKFVTESGDEYWAIAQINIPAIGCKYGIINKWSDELLKKSPCHFHGASPNQIGNFCVIAHNYRNDKFFSHVPELQNGDIIEITDLTNTTLRYAVYAKYEVNENDLSCTSQLTDGYRDVTLITCTDDGSARVIVKAREIEE